MAGGASIGEEADNPVAINATAMVDVIFCLCIFFMCSFHFKQLEGKLDSWLPKDVGPHAVPIVHPLEEIRVLLQRDGNGTVVAFGARVLGALPEEVKESAERARILEELE